MLVQSPANAWVGLRPGLGVWEEPPRPAPLFLPRPSSPRLSSLCSQVLPLSSQPPSQLLGHPQLRKKPILHLLLSLVFALQQGPC